MALWTDEGVWARNVTRETGDRWKGRTGVSYHQLAETKRNPLIR
jgi:long-subunit fatty acid transport protein